MPEPITPHKAWMKPPPGVEAEPEELKNPSERLIELLSSGWSQFWPEAAKPGEAAPAKKSALVDMALPTDKPARGLTFGDTNAEVK